MWEDVIKKARYGQPDSKSYFRKLRDLQSRIDEAEEFAKRVNQEENANDERSREELDEVISELERISNRVFELLDALM